VSKPGKSPSSSFVESRYLLMPDQANGHNTAFGGVIMAWIDMVGAMAAQKHCKGAVVTASIDKLSFFSPIYVGEHVILKAMVNYVGKSSMEVGVQVTKENPKTGVCARTTTAYLTFVQVDQNGNPLQVPPLLVSSKEEIKRESNAKLRVLSRKELLKKIKS
jgi:acyl-CoA hydrolase